MAILAAAQFVISRTSDSRDVLVGTPVANRSRVETERLIGLFVNTIVIRSYLDPALTFGELLRNVRETVLEAYAHQDVPFEKVVDEFDTGRSLNRSPLFQVLVVLQNAPQPVTGLPELALQPVYEDHRTAKFDLTITVEETEGKLSGYIEYATELFDRSTITAFSRQSRSGAPALIQQPDAAVGTLPLVGKQEREQLEEWNRTEWGGSGAECVQELFEGQVEKRGNAIAVVSGVEEMSYGELERRANQMARYLRKHGVGAESRVGICLERGFDLVVALLGVLKAGGCYVPLDPEYPVERQQYMVGDSGAGVGVPIGRPVANTQVYVVEESGRLAPVGAAGELYIGGAGLARGYLNRPELTAERFVPHAFSRVAGERLYRSGDRVRWRRTGELEFLGRMDEQVKLRGYRIELGEIESVLLGHEGVKQGVVVVRKQGEQERLVAYVVVEETKVEETKGGGEAGGGNGGRWEEEKLKQYLRQYLPEYMVPARMVKLDRLPQTGNGKIDRQSLPEPEERASEGAGEGPGTAVEEILAGIWVEVLNRKAVGMQDNFFELGGDSILSMQIVARARQAGLEMNVRDLFQHPRIADLALVVRSGAVEEPEWAAAEQEGERLPLLPVQRWFFERGWEQEEWFNQAVMLEVKEKGVEAVLGQVMEELERHHSGLRMRFGQNGEGEWEQWVSGEKGAGLKEIDLSGLDEEHRRQALAEVVEWAQTSLSLQAGPLLRSVLVRMGEGERARLLMVIHHLVVDGVSWRILLEDLENGCRQAGRGEPVRLGRRTSTVGEWARRLEAAADAWGEDEAYWEWLKGERQSLPRDVKEKEEDEGSANTVASGDGVELELSAEWTRALLEVGSKGVRANVEEMLMTALVETLGQWTGQSRVEVEMEGHGREELLDGVELSCTVGWFTALYPVRVERVGERDWGARLARTKETLRRVPRRGVSYGVLRYRRGESELKRLRPASPEVSFNYLGRFDQMLEKDSSFALAKESAGAMQHAGQQRPYLLDIVAAVTGDCLRVTWGYSRGVHHRSTVEELARKFVANLEALLQSANESRHASLAPSDFPLAQLSQEDLTAILDASCVVVSENE